MTLVVSEVTIQSFPVSSIINYGFGYYGQSGNSFFDITTYNYFDVTIGFFLLVFLTSNYINNKKVDSETLGD